MQDGPDDYTPWIEAVRGGPPSPGCFTDAAAISETVNLGTVALRAGEGGLDSQKMRITNAPDANQYPLSRIPQRLGVVDAEVRVSSTDYQEKDIL